MRPAIPSAFKAAEEISAETGAPMRTVAADVTTEHGRAGLTGFGGGLARAGYLTGQNILLDGGQFPCLL